MNAFHSGLLYHFNLVKKLFFLMKRFLLYWKGTETAIPQPMPE
jgi:hypothetical protein